jgi:hypothetical protein
MSFFDVRRARVRREFAELYPEIVPDMWISASRVARLVGRSRRNSRTNLVAGTRILSDAHFEFRGGRRGRQYLTGNWTPRVWMVLG